MQWVNRPSHDPELHDFRGLSGQIAGGIVRRGQPVLVLRATFRTRIKDVSDTTSGSLDEAFCPQSVTLVLEDHLDVSHGDILVSRESPWARVRVARVSVG